jgi:putative ABC transport system substrate-binding protein
MKRRQFLTLCGGAIMWPLEARAQQQRGMPHIGVLIAESAPHPFTEAFRRGLRELGYVEGQTIGIEWRYADALYTRAVELA